MRVFVVTTLILLSTFLSAVGQTVVPGFTAPDTVCVDEPFTINNTTTGATNYYWSFCSANLEIEPEVQNLGTLSGNLNQPVFMDYVFTNNKYYGFITSYRGGNLIRLDFGNSLLNNPAVTNLGNFNGLLPIDVGSEGIQLVQNEGKWYAIIVSGYPPSGSNPKVIRIAFGADIENPTPVATDWGNLGNMYQPIDLQLFRENGVWYGLTVNAENNTITRFNFTSSFENTPTGTNLGNIGNLAYPTGLYAINDGGTWRVFVTNAGDRTRTGGEFSITRLDFGNSLLNDPVGTNLGNLGNMLGHPRDLTIIRSCEKIIGFVVNGHPGYNNMVRIDFNNDLTSIPTPTTLSITNFAFPHSISKLFRVNEDVYGFVTDAQNNTISRIRFPGCNNSSIPSSSLRNPPAISYNAPGTYNINLTVDIGLPTQTSFCKKVVVTECIDQVLITPDTTVCAGTPVQLRTYPAVSYQWTPALYLNNPTAARPVSTPKETIKYYVQATLADNSVHLDSITITVKQPFVKTNEDTTICAGAQVQLNTQNGVSFSWSPAAGLSSSTIANPVARPSASTQYIVSAVDVNGCLAKDTVNINVSPIPVVTTSNDTMICAGTTIPLTASGGSSYLWSPAAGLNDYTSSNPMVTTINNTVYRVRVTGSNGCVNEDSVRISVRPYPVFSAGGDLSVCEGEATLLRALGGDRYLWSPATLVDDPTASTTSAMPVTDTTFNVTISENTCNYDTTISLRVAIHPKPVVEALSSNDVNCTTPTSQLSATGADSYLWQPSRGLDQDNIRNPVAFVDTTTTYQVIGTTEAGCSSSAFVTVKFDKGGIPSFLVPNAFTPNGDGKNDCFGLKRWGDIQIQQFTIYNRWGQVVFQTSDRTACWDGTFNGNLQPSGGYVYIVRAQTFCGPMLRKGTVMLIR